MTEPLVDICMLVHSQSAWADLAIRAVEHQVKTPHRLILVDQASTDPKVHKVLADAEKRGHTVLRLPENRSFSNGNNAGIGIGKSKFVMILNDDALVCENTVEAMIQDASEQGVGLVAARTNFAAGPSGDPSWVGDAPWVAFVAVMMRREVWEKVGPLDEKNFDGFSGEDVDLSLRIREAGFRIKLSSGYVLHAGSRSIKHYTSGGSTDVGQRETTYAAHNEKYARVLADKWGAEYLAEKLKLRQRVLVTSYHAEDWTRVTFAGSLLGLKSGGGGATSGGYGVDGSRFGFSFYQSRRLPIHLARQLVCDYACDNGFDVLVQFDDDATFPHDVIHRLLAHEKECVSALAYQRKAPYLTVAYDLDMNQLEKGVLHGTMMGENLEHTGLCKVDVTGFHTSAIRMSVIKKMRAHRCEKHPDGIKEYWGGFQRSGEDFQWAANCKHIGVQLYLDTNLVAGHIAESPVVDEAYKAAFKAGRAL